MRVRLRVRVKDRDRDRVTVRVGVRVRGRVRVMVMFMVRVRIRVRVWGDYHPVGLREAFFSKYVVHSVGFLGLGWFRVEVRIRVSGFGFRV